uniref:BPTI/Kunitz inhibitor domain-containing protein n=1 Tax=Acrobeloides nanus TaxID=290746 RepID=A0A914EC91_9BILA
MPSQSFPQPQSIPQITASASFGSYPYMSVSTSGSPCSLPQQIGTGPYRIPRWYFNPARMRCELFYWSGCCGNGNNFPNFQACQQSCEESPNPCAYGTPTTIIQCASGSVMTQTCTGQQFCHVGASPQTTICCNKPTNVDRCQQPLNVGIGNANLQRWYYNPLSQQCQTCVYRGLQGNENNFLSRSDCENSCAVNPCARGVPYKGQGVTVQCSTSNQAVCPAGYYCHFGADMQTTVCCQALVSNPCNDPVSKGEGKASLTRFYYDQDKRQCLPFNYLGTKGNTNNFLSQEACETVCPVWVNPCTKGEPIMGINNRPEQCHHRQPCPTGYYCHIGYDDETTVCCPSQILDPCSAPMNEGVGPHVMTRWYYETQTRKCQQFTYKGLHGNENNFLLRDHCEQACPVWDNACPAGEPILMTNQRPRQCNPQSEESCPVTHWCHHGVEPASTVCCPGRQDPCVLPKVEGEGKFSQLRWYFDLETKTCIQFNFRGMKGNANNFVSQEDCESKCPVFIDPCPTSYTFSGSNNAVNSVYLPCSKETKMCPDTYWCHVGDNAKTTVCCPNAVDPCALVPKISGLGELRLTRWSFDSKTRKCEPFDYYGLKGNQNNFLTRDECESKCPVFENPCRSGEPFMLQGQPQICKRETPCPSSYYCHIGSNDIKYCCPVIGGDPCGQPMDRGRGTSQLPRWYWDQAQQKCLPFTYCGQKGTQNNFLTQQDCERTCFELDNPCALGNPQMVSETEPQFCTVANRNTCGPTYWCHFGAVAQTTLCCPGKVEGQAICQQPMSMGSGESSLQRWYYDSINKCCVQFVYKGRYGNQNNFLTRQECEQTCIVFVNVCPFGEPLLGEDNRPLTCTFGSNSCGPSHWCHLGLVPDEYQCCPGEPTNPGACQGLPEVEGEPGPPEAPPQSRWFYNSETRTCVQFIYNGRKGNQDNFLTQEDCEATCPVFVNPCTVNIPLPPETCTPNNQQTCTPGSWCHIGSGPDTTLCCPNAVTNPCLLPMSTGEGNSNLERFYFDQNSKSCKPFTYAGLKGNQNNFLSLRACQLQCQPLDNPCIGQPATTPTGQVLFCSATNRDVCPVNFWCHLGAVPETTVCCPGPTNPCSVPLAPGTGNAGIQRWYYNPDDRECVPFQYNGKRGNQNNFLTQAECARTCPEQLCLLSIDRGACAGRQTRYAFNRQSNQCVPFEYTGCGGNLNNFQTMADCMGTCGNIGFRRR